MDNAGLLLKARGCSGTVNQDKHDGYTTDENNLTDKVESLIEQTTFRQSTESMANNEYFRLPCEYLDSNSMRSATSNDHGNDNNEPDYEMDACHRDTSVDKVS